jgi:hypothetical protein
MTDISCQWVNACSCVVQVLGPVNAVHSGAKATVAHWHLDDWYCAAIDEFNGTATVVAPAKKTDGVTTCSDAVKRIEALCESHGVPFHAIDTTYTRPPLPPLEVGSHYSRNSYECDNCGCRWDDVWNCEIIEDDCPTCGSRHWIPNKSEAIVPTCESDSASGEKPAITINDDAWQDEYQPGELIDLRIDQLPPHNPACLWSQINDDEGLYIVNGFHFVDREGFYLTAKPAPAGQTIRVVIDCEDTSDGSYPTSCHIGGGRPNGVKTHASVLHAISTVELACRRRPVGS